ncbi:hypothetical protein ACFP2F_20605 [Hymenobacter artigasi]|uniref:Phospholipase D-like domain-containing protein n=1 Tax=Hymenobacter artigasi TaxID=2719616 RepID=A0ABX1HQS9_9BACT|nr:hypothetical protein [Hymenobacter artigasi]NKI91567.1 hypothetical protein [Hymenobacter artigasi]
MKIIQSHDIQSKLMNVILTAKKELVLVSPYVNLAYTKQVSAAIVAARQKGVKIDFYIREDSNTDSKVSRQQVLDMGITPRLIPNLHAKLYFNESTGIIASLNLLSSSIGNSIEIGGQLETPAEIEELRLFIENFITPHEIGGPPAPVKPAAAEPKPVTPEIKAPAKSLSDEEIRFQQQPFGQVLADYLSAQVDRRCNIEGDHTFMTIRAVGNTFSMLLDNAQGATSQLLLRGVVSGSEVDRFARKSATHFKLGAYDYMIKKGTKGHYDQVQAVRRSRMSATGFDELSHGEKKALLSEVAHFLLATQSFKADYRN